MGINIFKSSKRAKASPKRTTRPMSILASWFVRSIPAHRVLQWRRLQRLVGPQDRYGERSEEKASPLQPKESEPLGAPTCRPPSPVIGLFSFLRSERRFLLRGGSFSLSNSVQRSVKHGNDRQHKPEGAEKAGRRRCHCSRSTEVNGPVYGRCTGKRALAAVLPGNDAEPPSNL